MKKLLKERFIPSNYTISLYNQMAELKQGSSEVAEYIHKFEKFLMKVDIDEREEQTMARFLNGLERNIAQKVELQAYSTLDELFHLSLKVEKHAKEKAFKKPWKSTHNVPKTGTIYMKKDGPSKKVFDLKEKGRVVSPNSSKESIKCFKCKGYGHYQSECPTKRVMTIGEIQHIEV